MRKFLVVSGFAVTHGSRLPCQGHATGRSGAGIKPFYGPLARSLGQPATPDFLFGGGDSTTAHKPSPTACCGNLPYDSRNKGCCPVPGRDQPVVYNLGAQSCCNDHIIELDDQGCCSGLPYNRQRQDCCVDTTNITALGQITDGNMFPGCRCEFTDWSPWSSCESGFAGGWQERRRKFIPKMGFEQKSCPRVPKRTSMSNRRDNDGNGNYVCVENMGSQLTKKLFRSKYYKDLIILLDESTSIKASNFEYAKDLVVNIVHSLCGGIGPDANRVSVIRYSSQIKPDIHLSDAVTTDEVIGMVKGFKYKPIKNKRYSGSTWTASAMDYVYNKVLATEVGWRRGVGPYVCNGVVLQDTCYFVTKMRTGWDNAAAACNEGSRHTAMATPVRGLASYEFDNIRKMLSVMDADSKSPWIGVRYMIEFDQWQYDDESFASFLWEQHRGKKLAPWMQSFWRSGRANTAGGNCVSFGSADPKQYATFGYETNPCEEERPVLCQRQPLDYLSVNTELLLITDGRSNDPREFGLRLGNIKKQFTEIGVQVSAIGVGRINEGEIRTLTDNRPGQILYLMSWQSVSIFNRILGRLRAEANYDAETCLPLEVDSNDLLWKRWLEILENEGILQTSLNRLGGKTVFVDSSSLDAVSL